MDEALASMIVKQAAKVKGSRLKYEVPETINRSSFSEDSLDVLENFGLDAPALLNNYACSLEDALVSQVSRSKDFRNLCIILKDEVERLRELVPEEYRRKSQGNDDDD